MTTMIEVTMPATWESVSRGGGGSKVPAIKLIRSLTGSMLAEAKEISEKQGPQVLCCDHFFNKALSDGSSAEVAKMEFNAALKCLQGFGVHVAVLDKKSPLILKIKDLAKQALDNEEFQLARDLSNVLAMNA